MINIINIILESLPDGIFQTIFTTSAFVACLSIFMLFFLSLIGSLQILETMFSKLFIFSIVPLTTGFIYFFTKFPPFPMITTSSIWVIIAIIMITIKIKNIREEQHLISHDNFWRCNECKTLNSKLFVSCTKCSASRNKILEKV